jgi:hypothetical protein
VDRAFKEEALPSRSGNVPVSATRRVDCASGKASPSSSERDRDSSESGTMRTKGRRQPPDTLEKIDDDDMFRSKITFEVGRSSEALSDLLSQKSYLEHAARQNLHLTNQLSLLEILISFTDIKIKNS